MFLINVYLSLIIIIPLVFVSARPTLKLTITPDEKYFSRDQQVEIQCELLNPVEGSETPQLWYIDLKTGKRTPISRLLLTSPTDDAPEIFKNIKNKRYEFVKKNHIRIRRLHMEDSAKYECNCPDCVENIAKVIRDLTVVKLVEPRLIIEPGWPLHENSQTTIKCVADDFYPYVGHKILRNHLEMTEKGRSSLSNGQIFPQKFIWEATVKPEANWHNSTLRCVITEGHSEQQTSKVLDVLFAPRFLKCDERQHIDIKQDKAVLSCSYGGNPSPVLTWRRQVDQKLLTNNDLGITIETKDEHQGNFQSLLKVDRTRFLSNSNGTTENLYDQFLSGGFQVQLTVNGNDRGSRLIHVVRHANEMRSNRLNSSTKSSSSSSFFLALISSSLWYFSTNF